VHGLFSPRWQSADRGRANQSPGGVCCVAVIGRMLLGVVWAASKGEPVGAPAEGAYPVWLGPPGTGATGCPSRPRPSHAGMRGRAASVDGRQCQRPVAVAAGPVVRWPGAYVLLQATGRSACIGCLRWRVGPFVSECPTTGPWRQTQQSGRLNHRNSEQGELVQETAGERHAHPGAHGPASVPGSDALQQAPTARCPQGAALSEEAIREWVRAAWLA